MAKLPVSGIYRHFKDNLYRVYTTARNTETGEMYVVYQALYGSRGFYVRPLEMFMSDVDRTKYPDAKQKKRFELIQPMPGIDELAGEAGFQPE